MYAYLEVRARLEEGLSGKEFVEQLRVLKHEATMMSLHSWIHFIDGRIAFAESRYKEAVLYFDSCLQAADTTSVQADRDRLHAWSLYDAGLALEHLGERDGAARYFAEMLERRPRLADAEIVRYVARAAVELGLMLESKTDFDQAREVYSQALNILENIENRSALDTEHLILAIGGTAGACYREGRWREAADLYDRARGLIEGIGQAGTLWYNRPICLHNQAVCYWRVEDERCALAILEELIVDYKESQDGTVQELVRKARQYRKRILSSR